MDGTLSQAETKRVAKYIKDEQTDNVADAIQAIRLGDDLVAKSERDIRMARNHRAAKQVQKSLEAIDINDGDSAEKVTLLSELDSIQSIVNRLIKQLKATNP